MKIILIQNQPICKIFQFLYNINILSFVKFSYEDDIIIESDGTLSEIDSKKLIDIIVNLIFLLFLL